jgi:hypothetical protein
MLILSTVVLLLPATAAFSHPGHADPVTISRGTATYIKQIVPVYLQVQQALSAGRFDADAGAAAGELKQLTSEAHGKEKDPSGKRMYHDVSQAAGALSRAADIDAARGHFADLNDVLLPFFDSWSSYRDAHDVVIYVCKTSERWWMQKKGAALIPYAGGESACGELLNSRPEEK